MIRTIYSCDNCFVEVETNGVPCDWFVLGFFKVKCMGDTELKLKTPIKTQPQWQETHHFCSEECMNKAVIISQSHRREG